MNQTQTYQTAEKNPADKVRSIEDELKIRFTYHPPSPEQTQRYVLLREEAYKLALLIVRNTPNSREQATALTKLEEAIFSANAAIARRENAPSTTSVT